MHRDRSTEHPDRNEPRKEWGRTVHQEHDDDDRAGDLHPKDAVSKRIRKIDGARQIEALRQIRELRARY